MFTGLDDPRATDIFGDPLPGPRVVSVKVHTDSDSTTQMIDLSHFSMEFGQFVSHDIQRNALSKGMSPSKNGGRVVNLPNERLVKVLLSQSNESAK